MTRIIATILALSIAAPASATATHWHSVSSASKLGWTARWEGVPVKGEFPDFQVTGTFDAESPAGGAIEVAVDTRTVDTTSADIIQTIRSKPWFDTGQFPRAHFSGTFAAQSQGLRLSGTLEIKGRRRQVTFPVTLTRRGADRVLLTGGVALDRGDFAIGSGQWQDGSIIAKKVTVDFSVVLVPRN